MTPLTARYLDIILLLIGFNVLTLAAYWRRGKRLEEKDRIIKKYKRVADGLVNNEPYLATDKLRVFRGGKK